MINNSTKDKLENETLHFGNTLLGAVLLTKFEKMKNTFDRTVYFLCLEIDELKEEVKYWRAKYEEEKNANAKMLDDNLKQARQGVANALRFALSIQDDEDGNLVISKENRQSLAETWSKHCT